MKKSIHTVLLVLITGILAHAEERPNIVVFMADDLGIGDLGCYGSDRVHSPNIDRLAAEGMRFAQFYTPAPSCSPARAGSLTGRSPLRLGIYNFIPENSDMHLKKEETTIAMLLQKTGYETCFAGKWGVNGSMKSSEQPQPNDHGFNHWLAAQNNAIPSHLDPKCFFRNGQAMGVMKGYSGQIITDEAIEWLNSRKDNSRPFCLFVWFHEPHRPIATPDEFTDPYRERFPEGTSYEQVVKAKPDLPKGIFNAPTVAEYLGNIAHLDHQVGRMMKQLDELGVSDNTLVLFTSDNGPIAPGSTAGLRGAKGTIWEGGIRMPGIIRWPARVKAGQTCEEPVTGLDLLPTFCDASKTALPTELDLDGDSFLPLLEGREWDRENPLFWWYSNKAALRDGDWKLVGKMQSAKKFETKQEWIKEAKLIQFELYNLTDDPAEKENLAKQHPERTAEMKKQLKTLYTEMQAEGECWPEGSLPAGKGKKKKS